MVQSLPITPTVLEGGPHEAKFVLPATRVPAVLAFLGTRLCPDPEHPEAFVSSLYYDTPGQRYLADKESSDYLKTKIRVRWYSDSVTGALYPDAFLEAKSKEGARRAKTRVVLAGQATDIAALSLTDPKLRHLITRLTEEGVRLEPGLVPLVHIRYRRRRYVLPRVNARVCVDWDIRTPVAHPTLGAATTRPLPTAVIEIKGHERVLPTELVPLSLFGARLASFSKYLVCIDAIRERT